MEEWEGFQVQISALPRFSLPDNEITCSSRSEKAQDHLPNSSGYCRYASAPMKRSRFPEKYFPASADGTFMRLRISESFFIRPATCSK